MTSTPISNAARLLRECAEEIKSTCSTVGEWSSEAAEDKAAYEERIAAANLLEAMPSSCLHQIQEPPTKTEALAHYSQQAILAMGEASAAAVAVPDERAAFEKWASFVGYSIKRWQADANLYEEDGTEDAWVAWQHRAALASTPAAAAPVVLPEPEAVINEVMELVKDWAQRDLIAVEAGIDTLDEESSEKQHQEAKRLDGEAETAYRAIEAKLRALLAGVSAPAALAVEMPEFDLRTSQGGRGFVAWYFANVLGRHDFAKYISTTLAADFACALAQALHAPQAQADARDAAWLQPADMVALERFDETTDDDQSYDIGKDAVQRLARFGCLQNLGFGQYSITAFGNYVLNNWALARELPFKMQSERDAEHRAAIAQAAQQGGAA